MHKSDDIAEFREYVKNVIPLKRKKFRQLPVKIFPQLPKPHSVICQEELLEVESIASSEVNSETILSFSKAGIQHKLLRQLRQGQLTVEGELDLHGLTVAEAKTALTKFLWHCQQQQLRCIRIIHGKSRGKKPPILKNQVNQWLRRLAIVLAFHSAKANDGGTGVLYVLLKRMN